MLSGLLLDTKNITRNGKVEIALHTVRLDFLYKITNTKCTKEKYVEKGKSLVVLSLWWVEQDRCYLPSPDLLLHCFQGILSIHEQQKWKAIYLPIKSAMH